MRFRRVSPDLIDGGGSVAAMARRRPAGPRRRVTAQEGQAPTAAAVAFAGAWMSGDRDGMARSSTPDVVCRWVGFEPAPLEAVGLDALIEMGREFERRHGVADRYSVVDSMGGASHAALLFEMRNVPAGAEWTARVAIYRVEDGRVAGIAVYADVVS
jgi:hypothetical protein